MSDKTITCRDCGEPFTFTAGEQAFYQERGYSEPQRRLLLHRRGLRVVEVGVSMRGRLAGRTTLTPARACVAFARACLALFSLPASPRIADLGPDAPS